MEAAPETTFEAVAQFATGLVGTLGVQLIDNQGATTIARTTAGISEFPVGSGIYHKTMTAPAVAGQYTIVWDDTSDFAVETLTVTASAATYAGGTLYTTVSEMKDILTLQGQSNVDDQIELAIQAASRAIDNACDRGGGFFSVAATRYYTAGRYDTRIETGDIQSISAVTVDTDGDGTFETTWVNGTDFFLAPFNAATDSEPYTHLELLRQASRVFPSYANTVKVVGTFGWATVPAGIKQYTEILAVRLLRRARDAPFGFVLSGPEGKIGMLARQDPDFELLVGPYRRTRLLV